MKDSRELPDDWRDLALHELVDLEGEHGAALDEEWMVDDGLSGP